MIFGSKGGDRPSDVSTGGAPNVAIVGAGPIGIELAVAFRQLGVNYTHFESGQIGHTISWYPRGAHFFSSPERISIAGVPLFTAGQQKATREEYLTYLRAVVAQFDLDIRAYERVTSIDVHEGGSPRFRLETERAGQPRRSEFDAVVLATGDMHRPRRLEVPGEDLAHVSHYFDDPHDYFRQRLLIVGGKNSAAEAALRCHRAGAEVTISYRKAEFPRRSVKAWILPDLENQIRIGNIGFRPETVPVQIDPNRVELESVDGTREWIDSDFVLLMTGYTMDPTLFKQAGAAIDPDTGTPQLDEATQETTVPGLFVAGTASAGTQRSYRLFIENCHPHVRKITRAICGRSPLFETDDRSRVSRDLPEQ